MSDPCYHCGLPVDEKNMFKAVVAGKEHGFCCIGCQTVCLTIHESGLQGFYSRTPQGEVLAPPPDVPAELTAYDLDDVQREYVDKLERERTINLLIEGIHCPACVWLIEKALQKQPGVLIAEVNLTAKRLKLRWDNEQTQLSHLIQLLSQIGYAAVPFDLETADGALAKRHRDLLYRMAFAGFAMMNIMWVTIAMITGASEGEFRNWFQWVGFCVATPTLLYSGYPFFKNAWYGLKRLNFNIDLPVAVGATSIYLYSIYITVTKSTSGETFFNTVVEFLFIILLGRYLQAISRRNAMSATHRLVALQPKLATLLEGETQRIVPIRTVQIDDLVLVRPGEKVPVDGQVVIGESALDESMISGESRPVLKQPGDKVIAGSVNTDGALTVKVEAVLRNTVLSKILDLMNQAQTSKAPIQSLADRIVPWFVLVTLFLAAITFVFWIQIDFQTALFAAVSVLIVTCPCAFGLATPMSIAVASGAGANHGILVKQGAALESLSKVNHFVFDKTGTLTKGQLQLVEIRSMATASDEELLVIAASAEQHSEHSVARAIVTAAVSRGLSLPVSREFISSPGRGIRAEIDAGVVHVGTANWLVEQQIEITANWYQVMDELESKGISCVFVARNQLLIGLLGLQDTLRDEALTTIKALLAENIKVTVLSGDKQNVVNAVTADLGNIKRIAEVLPEDKQRYIQVYQEQGDCVAMVGDGINDSPALIQADVGIALAAGTDVSIESADIVLSHNNLRQVVLSKRLATRTLRNIKQNITFSIGYNMIMVPLAMMAYVTPLFAAVVMPISSLIVIGNSARIRRIFKRLS